MNDFHYPGVKIISLGVAMPPTCINNEELAKQMLNRAAEIAKARGSPLTDEERKSCITNDAWIQDRTGIIERHHADTNQATSDLAAEAIQNALSRIGLPKEKLEFIIVATVSPDHPYSPPTACLVQGKLGLPTSINVISNQVTVNLALRGILTVDVSVACSSFIVGLQLAYALLRSGQYRYGAVVGADKMSTTVNPLSRDFYILMGDGAGALILQRTDNSNDTSFLTPEGVPNEAVFFTGSEGKLSELIIAKAGGSHLPITVEMLANPFQQPHKLWQDGRSVFKIMVNLIYNPQEPAKSIIGQACLRAGIDLSKIQHLVLHQANLRMLQPVMAELKKGGFDGKVHNNIQQFGNTTSATIPLCLHTAEESGELKNNDLVLAGAFGGGISWGVTLFHWTVNEP